MSREKVDERERLDALMGVAYESPVSFDVLEVLSRGLDETALAILCANVSTLPQYMKSSEIPYLSRSRMALRIDIG